MANPYRMSDPDLNLQFARDWGAGRFHIRLAAEASRWIEARREKRRQATKPPLRSARLRAWRAST